jgi:hypothetical protein
VSNFWESNNLGDHNHALTLMLMINYIAEYARKFRLEIDAALRLKGTKEKLAMGGSATVESV